MGERMRGLQFTENLVSTELHAGRAMGRALRALMQRLEQNSLQIDRWTTQTSVCVCLSLHVYLCKSPRRCVLFYVHTCGCCSPGLSWFTNQRHDRAQCLKGAALSTDCTTKWWLCSRSIAPPCLSLTPSPFHFSRAVMVYKWDVKDRHLREKRFVSLCPSRTRASHWRSESDCTPPFNGFLALQDEWLCVYILLCTCVFHKRVYLQVLICVCVSELCDQEPVRLEGPWPYYLHQPTPTSIMFY